MFSGGIRIDKIIVIIFGSLGIVFTYWFFLMKKVEKGDMYDH